MVQGARSILHITTAVAVLATIGACSQEPGANGSAPPEPISETNPAREFPDLVEWRSPAALSRAGDISGRPTLLYFAEEECGCCLCLQIAVLSVEEHAAFINRSFVPVKVVGNSELRSQFGVKGVPVLIVLNPASVEVGRLPGWSDAETTVAFLKDHAHIASPNRFSGPQPTRAHAASTEHQS